MLIIAVKNTADKKVNKSFQIVKHSFLQYMLQLHMKSKKNNNK